MAKREFPPVKAGAPVKTGANRDNKDASAYDQRGTSVADSEKSVGRDERYPNSRSAREVNARTLAMTVSIGDIGPDYDAKKQTVKTRGCGAAERGDKSSDKLA